MGLLRATPGSGGGGTQGPFTCEAEIRDTSCRPVRSEEETLAGAPRCSLRLTFLSRSTREIALGEVLPGGQWRSRPQCGHTMGRPCPFIPLPRQAQDPDSPACWIREAGVEATGSAALRSRLAVAPVGGPGGRARVAEPRSCPIRSSRSCSRRSRSTSSGFRAAPCGEGKMLVNSGTPRCSGFRHPHSQARGCMRSASQEAPGPMFSPHHDRRRHEHSTGK